jgi:hypothetical protein
MPYAPALSIGSPVAMYALISSSLSARNTTSTASTADSVCAPRATAIAVYTVC